MQNPANIGHCQKYHVYAKTTCNIAYQFKGKISEKIFQEAVNLVYKHHQSFKYNLDECQDRQNIQYVKNSENYQDEQNKLSKVLLQQITNLEEELNFLHSQSPDFLTYNNGIFLPVKFIILTGYTNDEFCIYIMYDHIDFDGTNINYFMNEIFQIYSKLLNGESVNQHIISLENRVILNEDQIYQKFKSKINFWQCFINILRILKGKYGDPGKLQWDRCHADKVFKNNYAEVFERGSKRQFQFIENLDFSQIFKGVKKVHPQVSKNSIVQAFLLSFFDNYSVNIRSKELNIDPESLRGLMSFPQVYSILPYEDYEKYQGNYLAQVIHAYDIRKIDGLAELGLVIHNDTQKLKSQYQNITNNKFVSPVYSNLQGMKDFISLDLKHTYITTSWTNFWLNQNTKVLAGAEFFRQSGGISHLIPKTDFPNLFISSNLILTMIGPNDEVSFSYNSLNEEQNVKVKEHLKVYYQSLNEKYVLNEKKQLIDAQN